MESPVYGVKPARDFYTELFADTRQSELQLRGIFPEANGQRLALYFSYGWTLADGSHVDFDVVDILEFDEALRITYLKIIYDTVQSRRAVDALR